LSSHDAELTWRGAAIDLAGAVARSSRPVSFVLGAGCSLSSGTPPTAVVHAAFEDATRGRRGSAEVRDLLHLIPEAEKQDILRPLFANATPYIGYLSLAALGRRRRMHILNLNWDTLLEQACDQLAVPYVSFDFNDRSLWREVDRLPPESGILIVHPHGILGDECRYETLATLRFDDDQKNYISAHFLAYTTVIVGASVTNDTDLHELLLAQPRPMSGRPAASQWYFGRPDATDQQESVRRVLLPGAALTYHTEPDVDFDQLIVTVLEQERGASWERLRQSRTSAGLPILDQVAWPDPALLRPLFPHPIVGLLGQARLGKTVIGHLLAYLRSLWSANYLWQGSDLPVRVVEGASDGIAALAGILSGDQWVYLVEDPFGSTDHHVANPGFPDELSRISALPSPPTVILTSRLAPWQESIEAAHSPVVVPLCDTAPNSWYTPTGLTWLARRLAPGRDDLVDSVERRELLTPARVRDAALFGLRGARPEITDDSRAEIDDKLELLQGDHELGLICSLARLQEFGTEPLRVTALDRWVDGGLSGVAVAGAFLLQFDFEHVPRVRLAHETDREATDAFIAASVGGLQRLFQDAGEEGRPYLEALRYWFLIAAARDTKRDELLSADSRDLLEWAPLILASMPTDEEVLDTLAGLTIDEWDLRDMSYELVRLWPTLRRTAGGRRLLRQFLDNRDGHGTYGLLESCLYLRNSTPGDIWAAVYDMLWSLLDEPGSERELAIAVDALMWRPPPERYREVAWAREFLRRATPTSERWGLLRFLAGFHAGGFPFLDVDELLDEDATVGWNSEQAEFASWLLRWHFIHQSRGRAQMARKPWVDKDFLCRALHPAPKKTATGGTNRLLQSFGDFREQAGWAVFVGCSLPAYGQPLDDRGHALVRRALERARPADPGLLAAVLTYETAAAYVKELRNYFSAEENREALLDALVDGLTIDGVELRPPRYMVPRSAGGIYEDAGLQWERLKKWIPLADRLGADGRFDIDSLARRLRERLDAVAAGDAILRSHAEDVLARVAAGDLRDLDSVAGARDSGDPYLHLLEVAARSRASRSGRLF
jgi:hypothetical protein